MKPFPFSRVHPEEKGKFTMFTISLDQVKLSGENI